MDKLELTISQYASTARNYRDLLIRHIGSTTTSLNLDKSTYSSIYDYLDFKKRSLNELIDVITKLIKQLDKYNKFKTLNKKILRGAINNSLIQGKFYDFAISYYNFIEVEPEIFELIDNHFKLFYNLSKQLEEMTVN